MAVTQRDYYEVLEVERDADQRTIKRAFFKKARELHPDVNDDPDAEEKFKEVNEAYSVLSDTEKRAQYDRYGFAGAPSFDSFNMEDIFGGFGVDDIFSSFFGGQGRRSPRRPSNRGRDLNFNFTITLAEAATGIKKKIRFKHQATCSDCEGTGSASKASAAVCSHCHGTGVVEQAVQTPFGYMAQTAPCEACQGTGEVVQDPCDTCGGTGVATVTEELEIEIPAGIQTGQQLSYQGMGNAGLHGHAAGDLLFTIYVQDDDRFQRQGADLTCQVEVNVFEALVGATKIIDGVTSDQKLELVIPAGTQHRDVIRLEGCGMPYVGTTRTGDLYCVVQLVVPKDLSESEFEQLVAMRDSRFASTQDSSASAKESHSDTKETKPKKPRPRKKSRKKTGSK